VNASTLCKSYPCTLRCPQRPYTHSESPCRCTANMAHVRQSRPDSGLGFQLKVLKPFEAVPSSLGRSSRIPLHRHCFVRVPGRNVKRFRGGLVFKAHRWLYHSTLGSRVIKKKKKSLVVEGRGLGVGETPQLGHRTYVLEGTQAEFPRGLETINPNPNPLNFQPILQTPNLEQGDVCLLSLLLSSLALSDTQVYEPLIRTLLGTGGCSSM